MFGYTEALHDRPGSRRLGGPVEFKVLWPALREDLREAYMANGGLDSVRRQSAKPLTETPHHHR
jgi:hypothetical protein